MSGDILEVSIPTEPHEREYMTWRSLRSRPSTLGLAMVADPRIASKHRGFAFLTFANPADAQEAIDNYDLNELPGYRGQGKFLKCSIAQPNRFGNEGKGDKFDRPGRCNSLATLGTTGRRYADTRYAVWESEEWLQQYAKPDGEGGKNGKVAPAAQPLDDES